MGLIQKQGIQNTILSYAGSALGFANKLLFLPQIFAVEQVGLINVLASFSLLYAQMSGFGIYNVIIRFYPAFKDQNPGAFLRLLLRWLFMGIILMTATFLLIGDWLELRLMSKAPLLANYFYLLLPLAYFTLLFEVMENYSRALLKTVFPSMLRDLVLRVYLLILLILYYFKLLNFDEFIIGFVVAYFINVVVLLVYLAKENALSLPKSTGKLPIAAILKFGFFVFLAESSSLLVSTIDAYMLSDYRGLREAGVYTTMILLASAFMIPYRSIIKVAQPIVARLWKDNDKEGIAKLYPQFSNNSFVSGALLFLAILINMELLFLVIPESYKSGVFVFVIIGLARLIEVFYGINGIIIVNSKQYKIDLVFVSALIVLTLGTNYLLIPRYGMQGAVWASFISISLINWARGLYLKSAFNFSVFTKENVYLLISFLVVFTIVYFLPIGNCWMKLALGDLLLLLYVLLIHQMNWAPEMSALIRKRLPL